ncbi:MAG: hypothetical protein KGQ84_03860 [Proteobacteria bacterium]|jgi:hypothetical protein|nr:hypothetical protein [Pseudomonadota bacterium]
MSTAKHLDRANLPARRQPKAFVILSAAKNLDLRQPGSRAAPSATDDEMKRRESDSLRSP